MASVSSSAICAASTPRVPVVATGTRSLLMGTELSRQFNILKTKTDDVYAAANWNLGDHDLKGGLDYSNNDVYNAFLQKVQAEVEKK